MAEVNNALVRQHFVTSWFATHRPGKRGKRNPADVAAATAWANSELQKVKTGQRNAPPLPRRGAKRAATARPANAGPSTKAVKQPRGNQAANFNWGAWLANWIETMRKKNNKKNARRAAFLIANAFGRGRVPNKDTRNAMYEIVHLNASHIAGLMGLWAELAIREGIRAAPARGRATSARRAPRSPTTTYTFNGPLRMNTTRNNGNKLNNNNNLSKHPQRVDYVVFKEGAFEKSRYAGISPFNFVFRDFVPNNAKPWDAAALGARMSLRTAPVTCFEKVRVDWNWVKLWCGAADSTFDVEVAGGKLVKKHSLPARLGGDLSAEDERLLKSGVPNLFPGVSNAAAKIARLKRLMKKIFEDELGLFAGDKKGDKSGETDGQFLRGILNSAGEIVGWEFIDDELKISSGKGETYPAEDVQLLKKLILNSLFLNCDYHGYAPIRLIRRTRSFFCAFGVAALESHIAHKKIRAKAGEGVAADRKAGINHIADEVNAIFNNGTLWDVYEVKPGSSAQRKLLAFPGCSFSQIVNKVQTLRNEYEARLGQFFKTVPTSRLVNMVNNDDKRHELMALMLLKDYDEKSRTYTNCRRVANNLFRHFKDQLGSYLSGFKKSAFIAYYRAGGGAANTPTAGTTAWRLIGANIGSIHPPEANRGRLEEFFLKAGPSKAGASQITGAGAGSPTSLRAISAAYTAFDAMLRVEMADEPRRDYLLRLLPDIKLINVMNHFVEGLSKASVASPRYTRAGAPSGSAHAAESPPKASQIISQVLANASKYGNANTKARLAALIAAASPNQRAAAFGTVANRIPNNFARVIFGANYNNLKRRRNATLAQLGATESQGSQNFNMAYN